MQKRIVIMGAGAVGGYFGAYLAKAGLDVTLVDPWPENVEIIRNTGIKLSGMTPEESMTQVIPALHLTEVQDFSKQKPIDIAIIATKSYDTEWATMMIRPYLAADGYVVSLQNCVNEERIAGVVGWGRTIGCIAANFASEMTGPGEVKRHYPRGDENTFIYRAGEPHGRITRRLKEFVEIANLVDRSKATTNLWGERWSKLCVNGMRNGLSASSGLRGNDLSRTDHIRRFMIKLGGQGVRIGQAMGFELEEIYKLDAEVLARASEGDGGALEEVEARMIAGSNSGLKSDDQRPSMAQDIAKKRRTEIDFLNGLIVDKGSEIGLATDAHEHIVRLVNAIERGEVEPSIEHFANL